jgi:branched-chain amino acid transport system ATP-binding protein
LDEVRRRRDGGQSEGMSAILEVEGVSKHFGALRAVDGVSFSVEPGEIFGIAGPNGSGKSTLFNIVTGVPFRALTGVIRFKGARIERLAPHLICRLGLARTFQRDAVFPSLTVRENVRVAVVNGARVGATRAGIDATLAACRLVEDRFEQRAGEISVFEKKKLTIATALATDPALILLDEPASGLTRPEVAELAELILALQRRGMTVLILEHVLSLLFEVCARLMVLDQGKVIVIGAPSEVIRDARVIEAYLGRRAERLHASARS